MAYKRQIAYFDLLEDGQKKGNAGFCKWEQRNDYHVLAVSIGGLPGDISENTGVYTKTGNMLGSLKVIGGRAEAAYQLDENGCDWCQELVSIHIPLSKGKELMAEFQSVEKKQREHEAQSQAESGIMAKKDIIENSKPMDMVLTIMEKIGKASEEVKRGADSQVQPTTQMQEQPKIQMQEQSRIQVQEQPKIQVQEQSRFQVQVQPQLEPELQMEARLELDPTPKSLWDRLASTHVKMRPFGTQTEYYRMALEDIYLLKEECHILRNNQFLLHGYYNYHYLILGKKDNKEDQYWLGVPGIYHEREKMAARMYGFEKFEGAKPNYGVGDLGYYLISAE